MKFQVIDLFCGAGGVTSGIKKAVVGDQTKQKWMIGNMVHPIIPKKWFEALYVSIIESEKFKKVA